MAMRVQFGQKCAVEKFISPSMICSSYFFPFEISGLGNPIFLENLGMLIAASSANLYLRPLSDKGKPVVRLGRKATGQTKI